ncbi:hypothetical protein DFS34DRAFT_342731 [Phlyctochytrium arcticum]|nr:hypothetical protein DFS34DRAFT_342731 [Phlyctochytrium arcticum]
MGVKNGDFQQSPLRIRSALEPLPPKRTRRTWKIGNLHHCGPKSEDKGGPRLAQDWKLQGLKLRASIKMVQQVFEWKHGGEKVVLTGDFDDWSQSVVAEKGDDGVFRAKLERPPHTKIIFKFVVDEVWRNDDNYDIETDESVSQLLRPPRQRRH